MFTTTSSHLLLVCGIAAAVLFVIINVLAGSLWGVLWTGHSYNYIRQSISELSAIGAPTRALGSSLTILYSLLMIAFGVGVWQVGGGNAALRVTAALLLGCSVLGLIATIFFPMRLGDFAGMAANAGNTIVMALSTLCMVLAIGAGTVALHNWFRWYSLATLALFVVLTLVGIFVLPRLDAQPVVRIGIQERTMVFFILLWVVLLALTLWREPAAG